MRSTMVAALFGAALLAACSSDPSTSATSGGNGDGGLSALGDPSRGRSGPGGAGSARPGSQEDLAATVGDRIFFDTDRSTVGADQRPVLERQAGWLQRYPQVRVTIEGHADERGTREYNLALGQRRANSTRDTLVANGVGSARVSTISFGKDQPAALGSDESSWAQNRRAVTSVR